MDFNAGLQCDINQNQEQFMQPGKSSDGHKSIMDSYKPLLSPNIYKNMILEMVSAIPSKNGWVST